MSFHRVEQTSHLASGCPSTPRTDVDPSPNSANVWQALAVTEPPGWLNHACPDPTQTSRQARQPRLQGLVKLRRTTKPSMTVFHWLVRAVAPQLSITLHLVRTEDGCSGQMIFKVGFA